MFFFRKKAEAPQADEEAPPPYNTGSNPAASGSDSKPDIVDGIQSLQAYQRSPIHADDEIIFSLESALESNDETHDFHFSRTKLEKRGCKGFLAFMKKHSTSETEEGPKGSNRLEFLSDHVDTPAAMKLFEEWVDTGRLRPTVKHKTASICPYCILYIFAWHMAHETLCNQIVDEIIEYCAETMIVPTAPSASHLYELAKDDMPFPLRELLVQYALLNKAGLERDLARKETWKSNADFDRELLLKLVQKAWGNPEKLVFPSKNTRCQFHVHTKSKPCDKVDRK